MFVCSLRNRRIDYANVTTLQLLAHMYTIYAKISAAGLESNTTRMKISYDVNLPIDTFFDQIKDAAEFTVAGNAPFIPVQVVNTAYNVVFSTGMFNDDCKIWKRKPTVEKSGPVSKLTLPSHTKNSWIPRRLSKLQGSRLTTQIPSVKQSPQSTTSLTPLWLIGNQW